MKEVIINSWEDLQKNISKITVSLNKNENLKLAAAANPLLALDELGYKINDDIKDQVEEKIRFKPNDAARLTELRSAIYNLAGKKFNVRSQEDLNAVLFDDLKIEVYDERGCLIKKHIKIRKKGEPDDELALYKDLHPIIEPLMQFRELDAKVAGFADKDVYEKIRNGKYGDNSNIQLTIRFKK